MSIRAARRAARAASALRGPALGRNEPAESRVDECCVPDAGPALLRDRPDSRLTLEIVRLKYLILGIVFPLVLVLDLVTKRWALTELAGSPSELFGGLVPLTLAFNKGAAFGVSIGEDSRWFFVPVTIVALGLLTVLLRQAEERDLLRIGAIALVVSGAVGNLYDRVRWDRGVVDFLGPIDLGFWDFPIFNVADMAITCGAVMLAISFWLEERQEQRAAAAAGPASPGDELSEEPSSG